MFNWYLVHTKFRQERIAMENLVLQGFECFLPQINIEKLHRGTLQVVQEALFPRYLFINLSEDFESLSCASIRSTVGVNRLITFGQNPVKVSNGLVSTIRSKTETSDKQLRHFHAGQFVVVTEGQFAGLEAIYQIADGETRVLVLLNVLSKSVKMFISTKSLQKVN